MFWFPTFAVAEIASIVQRPFARAPWPGFRFAFDCQGLDPGTVWILIAAANRVRCSDEGPGGSRAIPMCGRGRHHGAPCKSLKLLPDSEPVDQLAVTGGVLR